MLLFRHPPSGRRFGFTSHRGIIVNHKFASTLATNATLVVTNQPEANETKPTEPKTEKTIADGILTLNERILDLSKVVLKFAYTDERLEKKMQGYVRSEVAALEANIKGAFCRYKVGGQNTRLSHFARTNPGVVLFW